MLLWTVPTAHACMNEMVAADQSRMMAAVAFVGMAGAGTLTSALLGWVLYRRIRPSPLP
jgi:hypothetical protein